MVGEQNEKDEEKRQRDTRPQGEIACEREREKEPEQARAHVEAREKVSLTYPDPPKPIERSCRGKKKITFVRMLDDARWVWPEEELLPVKTPNSARATPSMHLICSRVLSKELGTSLGGKKLESTQTRKQPSKSRANNSGTAKIEKDVISAFEICFLPVLFAGSHFSLAKHMLKALHFFA